MQTKLVLSVKHRGKSVPYSPREGEESTNHGFKRLKGVEDASRQIPEAQDDPALQFAIDTVNGLETAFFTVGCEKAFNVDSNGHWARGYFEFAYNYPDLVADAKNYFPPFFNFGRGIVDNRFDLPVHYHWELEGATFLDSSCDGWTVAVWIETGSFLTAPEARECWTCAVRFLTAFLVQASTHEKPTMY